MVECYIPSNPFYNATTLQNATEQYVPRSRNADVLGTENKLEIMEKAYLALKNVS